MLETLDPRAISRLLADVERRVSLLERCRPENAQAETERVVLAWERGVRTAPRFIHAAPPDLSRERRVLDALANGQSHGSPVAELFAERAAELLLEVAIVENVGTAAVLELAAKRFPIGPSPFADRALEDAAAFVTFPAEERGRTVLAEDRDDPESLVRAVEALVGERRLPLRVEITPHLSSSAATGPGFIRIREGVRHTAVAARRIALHEVLAHAEPRERAKREPLGLFSAGTSGSAADEEGRALCIEERSGLLDAARRRELGARHLSAVAIRGGADFVEATGTLVERGIEPGFAVSVTARVCRGGGLAREIVYLPALHRVRAAFRHDPSLESWLERGRLSLSAARTLRTLAADASAHVNVATTGV